MPLFASDKLGPYEIVCAIGAGGMGEVYKACDTRLGRTVAIKVLPDHIAKREDLRARFEREARAVASLNHPNICTLYDIGLQDGAGYMVMEFMEGETLAERIEKGALPLEKALKVATQIADALDRAHRAGVTHRDVKPQNIMLTRDGVKVLDFGLAKSESKPGPTEQTLTAVLTTEGTIMGTPQYMAPEQFEGKEADARSDIWAFGAVLYEMITGQKAFQGKSYSSLVGAILSADPAPMSATPFTPAWLERLVRRCLAKEPERRYQSLRDVQLDLDAPPPEAPVPAAASRWPWVAAIATTAIATALAGWTLLRAPQTAPLATIRLSADGFDIGSEEAGLAISPDGRYLACIQAKGSGRYGQLMLRSMDQFEVQAIPGVADAGRPIFSPDSQWILYSTPTQTRKVSVNGGPSVAVNESSTMFGKAWGPEDTIVIAGPVLQSNRSDGGSPQAIANAEAGESRHRWPSFMPDGKSLLFNPEIGRDLNRASIVLLDLKSGTRRTLPMKGGSPRYVPTGHIVYARNSILFATPFDAKRLAATGPEVPVIQNVHHNPAGGFTDYSFSDTGHLAYLSEFRVVPKSLLWADRAGSTQPLPGGDKAYLNVRLSPRADRIVAEISTRPQESDIWVLDLARGINTPITSDSRYANPVWAPDGQRVAFSSGTGEVLTAVAAGGARTEVLIPAEQGRFLQEPVSWTPDGRTLLFVRFIGRTTSSIWETSLPGSPRQLVEAVGAQRAPRLSPDSKSLAYISSESGTDELYVQLYPTVPTPRVQVSTNGATQAFWSPDGKHLYFKSSAANSPLLSSSIQISGTQIHVGTPKKLFDFDGDFTGISPDGSRFLMLKTAKPDASALKLNIVLNWFDELRRLSPAVR